MKRVVAFVDDEKLREEVREALSSCGYTPVLASLDDPTPPQGDVLLVDFVPGAESAIEQLARPGRTPIVLLVDDIDVAVPALLHAAGAALKPIAPRELDAALKLAVHEEQRAARRERWFQTTLSSIRDAVITADEDSNITFINPAAQALTGWPEAEALGKSLDTVFRVLDSRVDPDADGDAAELPGQLLHLQRRGAGTCIIEQTAAPIVDQEGELHGVVVIFRDVTERLRVEQRLALAGRMTSIGTLAAGMAHELNNPLAFVTSNLGFVMTELDQLKDDPRVEHIKHVVMDCQSALSDAADGAARAARIVKDMKVFIRGDSEPNTPTNVNRAIAFAARLIANQGRRGPDLELNLKDVPLIIADEGKLVQVFVNLLTNATQALDPARPLKIRVTSCQEGDHVVVRVIDNGIGIPPQHLARVFEPFVTLRAHGQGQGLGLSIAHTLLTSFDGTIVIDSEVGAGTTVIVSLPVASQQPAPVQPQQGARVLVIAHEALIGTALRRILVKHGFEVDLEQDAPAIPAGVRYDVVICDLVMPGFSGQDLHRLICEQAPELRSRIVWMTGHSLTEDAFDGAQNPRLEKPFLPAEVVNAVNAVLLEHGRVTT